MLKEPEVTKPNDDKLKASREALFKELGFTEEEYRLEGELLRRQFEEEEKEERRQEVLCEAWKKLDLQKKWFESLDYEEETGPFPALTEEERKVLKEFEGKTISELIDSSFNWRM